MIYLIVGRTGAGKDYLVSKLKEHGLSVVKSYATRPKRDENENTHIFITPEEAKEYTDRVAETTINGYEYFATRKQVEESDIYIIDPNGIKVLTKLMPDATFHIVYVYADNMERRLHAVSRAENKIKEEQVFDERNASENDQFDEFEDAIKHIHDDFRFTTNVTAIDTYYNQYDELGMDNYCKTLIMHKELHDRMTKIVQECADMEIVRYADNDKTKLLVTNKKSDSTRSVTIEQFTDIVLNNPHGMRDIMQQYIMSPKMRKTDRFFLQASDGLSIETTEYPSLQEAKTAMKQAYEQFTPENQEDGLKDDSSLNEEDAILFANDKTYAWNILTVKN